MSSIATARPLARAIAALWLGAAVAPAWAVTTSWNGTQGSWSDAARWNLGLPGTTDVAIINAGTATLSTDVTVQGLLLGGSSVLAGEGALRVTGSSLWQAGRLTGLGSTTFEGPLALSSSGRKEFVGGRTVNTQGTTTWSGNTAATNNQLVFANSTLNNSGAWIDSNAFNSLMTATGANSLFNNLGSYSKQGNATTNASVAFNNTGTVTVSAGTLQISSAFTNHGRISTAAGATFLGSNASFVNAGVLAGLGHIATHANGDIVNDGGSIDPGLNGTGLLTLDGDLRNTASGVLNFELASRSDFDGLAVSGDVSLGGLLSIWNLGYVPVVGDRFVLLSFEQLLAGSRFASVQLQGFAPGLAMAVSYNLHDVTVTVTSAATAVPEPGSWALMLAGLGCVSWRLTNRRSCRRASPAP